MKNLLIVCLLAYAGQLFAQNHQEISISVFDESISFPSFNLTGGTINPGISISKTYFQTENKGWRFMGSAYYHEKLEYNVSFSAIYFYRQYLGDVYIQPQAGGGYAHSWYPGQQYKQNEDGDFITINKPLGRSHGQIQAGIEIGYLLSSELSFFTRYDTQFQSNFANGIPVMFHTLWHLGIAFQL
ncbi:MAG: hypothetical protein AB8G22_14450 [Saprospiraceae bacterium]